jgi:hypothetical protein
MALLKVLKKERVLTCGSGVRRAVLDFDAKLVYKYDDPSNIIAVGAQNQWFILSRPYYSSGGWGSGASGNPDGGHLNENSYFLLQSIEAKINRVDLPDFITQKAMNLLIKKVDLIKKKEASLKKAGLTFHVSYPDYSGKVEFSKDSIGFGIDPFNLIDKLESGIKVFTENKGEKIKIDSYLFTKSCVFQGKTVVAFRDTKGQIFMNSQVLTVSGFEKVFYGNESIVQKEIRKIAKYSIPLNVLESAKLNLQDTKILESGQSEDFNIKTSAYSETIRRHFTGALLLENHGKKFLMDIDRQEIENQIFNVFFCEVDSKSKTISEAYESMMPDEVKQAISKGIEVKRQGEWFFIKTDKTLEIVGKNVRSWLNTKDKKDTTTKFVSRFDIKHGKGRPNSFYKPVNCGDLDSLVCGLVKHSGREHKDLDLGVFKDIKEVGFHEISFETLALYHLVLWKLVPNTTVSNFT